MAVHKLGQVAPCLSPAVLGAQLCGLDLFAACEQMDRRCCMMEFDPHYADVIVDRWEKMTGLKALKVNGYTIGGGYLKTA